MRAILRNASAKDRERQICPQSKRKCLIGEALALAPPGRFRF